MDVVCLSGSSCLDPPPLSLYFLFLFYIHLLSGRICLVSSGANPRYPLLYAAVSPLQLPVSMPSFPYSSLSMFAAVASVQQRCCLPSLAYILACVAPFWLGYRSILLISSHLTSFVYTTKSQTFSYFYSSSFFPS